MTTRPRSKRRAPNQKNQACVGQTAGCGGGGHAVCFAIWTSRGSHLEVLYILCQSLVSRVCSLLSLPRSPLRAWLHLRALAFVAGLQLVGCLQKGTDVGRVLPVGDAGVGEAAVRITSASVRSRRTRGRWRLRQRVAPVAARQEAHRDEFGERRRGLRSVHPAPGSEVSQDQFGGQLLAPWRPLRVGSCPSAFPDPP